MDRRDDAVAAWERQILDSTLWEAHRAAHWRNFERRFSAIAAQIDPNTRLPGPRNWLVHTLSPTS